MRTFFTPAVFMLALLLPALTHAGSFTATFEAATEAPLANPHDLRLSADGTRLYVSDLGNDRIAVFDPDSLELLYTLADGELSGPHDVDLDAEGRLLVADTHNHRIAIYRLDVEAALPAGELSEAIRKPEGVLVHANGRVYATGAGTGNIVAYEDGRVVARAGGLSAPHDIAAAPDGDLWVADSGNDRILRMSPELEVELELSGTPYDFDGPRYLDVAPNGFLIIADKYSHSIKVVAGDGRMIAVLGGDQPVAGAGRLRTPEGVELRGERMWIADSGKNRILRFRVTFH